MTYTRFVKFPRVVHHGRPNNSSFFNLLFPLLTCLVAFFFFFNKIRHFFRVFIFYRNHRFKITARVECLSGGEGRVKARHQSLIFSLVSQEKMLCLKIFKCREATRVSVDSLTEQASFDLFSEFVTRTANRPSVNASMNTMSYSPQPS